MQKKKLIQIFVSITVIVAICCISFAYACKHKFTTQYIVIPATCTKTGIEEIVCTNCSEVVAINEIPATGHSFGEYKDIMKPSANKNGVEVRTCENCGYEESREVICPHENITEKIIDDPTCYSEGTKNVICNDCGTEWKEQIKKIPHTETYTKIIKEPTCMETGIECDICKECSDIVEEREIPLTEHTFGEWVVNKYATPFEEGEQYHICSVCGEWEFKSITVSMSDKMLYIPSVGIQCKFAVTYFTQAAVDNNDVVYTENAYAVTDPTNPFILGHYFGSLSTVRNTHIGDCIYVCKDGNVDTYKVIVSEHAILEKNGVYMIGIDSGTNIFDCFASAMNSNYASFGLAHSGIDRWDNVNNGKTLHIYTCDHINTLTEGRNGRWIILANLIDSQPIEPTA